MNTIYSRMVKKNFYKNRQNRGVPNNDEIRYHSFTHMKYEEYLTEIDQDILFRPG